jgi:hypothetical protein
MSWLIIPLAIQTMAGVALTFRNLSFNVWEESDGVHGSADRLALGTGIVFLSSAGLGWYAYMHGGIYCWGFTGLPLLKLSLDVIGVVLLYFVFFGAGFSSQGRGLQILRQMCGWLFGVCSIVALGVSFPRRGIFNDLGGLRWSTLIVSGVMVLLALVFAMAWWTTVKARPTARAWGITASIANLLGPLYMLLFRHLPLTYSGLMVVAISMLALVVYAWPNSVGISPNAEPSEDDVPSSV